MQFNFLFFLFVMRRSCLKGRYVGTAEGGFIHWTLQFGWTWRLLCWLADTKSNENTDRPSMLAISNSLISIP